MKIKFENLGKNVVNKETGEIARISSFSDAPTIGLDNGLSIVEGSVLCNEWELVPEPYARTDNEKKIIVNNVVDEISDLVRGQVNNENTRNVIKEHAVRLLKLHNIKFFSIECETNEKDPSEIDIIFVEEINTKKINMNIGMG